MVLRFDAYPWVTVLTLLFWYRFYVILTSFHWHCLHKCMLNVLYGFIYVYIIGIDTKIEVIVVLPTTWEAHHSPRAKPEGCGELPRSLVTPQWPKSRYQFLFYHDASKHIKFMQIRVCISRKSLIKLLHISHYGKHGHRPLSPQLP